MPYLDSSVCKVYLDNIQNYKSKKADFPISNCGLTTL